MRFFISSDEVRQGRNNGDNGVEEKETSWIENKLPTLQLRYCFVATGIENKERNRGDQSWKPEEEEGQGTTQCVSFLEQVIDIDQGTDKVEGSQNNSK